MHYQKVFSKSQISDKKLIFYCYKNAPELKTSFPVLFYF